METSAQKLSADSFRVCSYRGFRRIMEKRTDVACKGLLGLWGLGSTGPIGRASVHA